jgi:hypothetical protein
VSIENLVKVVPPPAVPDEPFDGPWAVIEAYIGTLLPEDYKDFVKLYGNGSFMDFLGVYAPMRRSPHSRLETQVRNIHIYFPVDETDPYPVWPAPGGLIPLGRTDNGDSIFWLARGAPEDWKVVVWGRGLLAFETFDCGLTDFLAGLASGEILPEDFPEDMLPCDHLFRPSSDFPAREIPPDWGPEPKLPVPAGWRSRWRSSFLWRQRAW